jgi:CDP-glycerol glycerophosphotransferase (TagB/SpsB family)
MPPFFRKIKTPLILLLSWMMYPLSWLSPRSNQIWIFVGWHKSADREIFADNSKYLFLYTTEHHKEIRSIWIAEDDNMRDQLRAHGYESYTVTSWLGLYYSLRAGYTIIDANMRLFNWRASGRSKVIQLWHADGIKGLELGSSWKLSKFREIIISPGLFRRIYFFIASSPYIATNFICPSFDVPRERVRITGLPRYDIFFKHIRNADIDIHQDLDEALQKVRAMHPSRILLYAPTFRRGKDADSPLAQLDLSKLNTFLSERNDFLFISLHPKFSTTEWLPKEIFSHISFVNPDFDKYPLLPRFDLVITDYSSLCLEFLLLDKPSIFFVYDFDEYRKDPGIPEDFWNLVPGPRPRTFDDLLRALTETSATRSEERKKAREILFIFKPGEASKNVAHEILKDSAA